MTELIHNAFGQSLKIRLLLFFFGFSIITTKNENNLYAGFEQTIKKYQAQNCNGCPLRGVCHKSKYKRVIEVTHNLNRHKAIAKEKPNTDEGTKKRKQRCFDVGPVFGNIKSNHKLNRFMLGGKTKVTVGFGLLALAQNLRKKAA